MILVLCLLFDALLKCMIWVSTHWFITVPVLVIGTWLLFQVVQLLTPTFRLLERGVIVSWFVFCSILEKLLDLVNRN